MVHAAVARHTAPEVLVYERFRPHLGRDERAGRIDGHHAVAVTKLPSQLLRLSRPHGNLEEHRPLVHERSKGHGRGRCHTPHRVIHEGRERAACLKIAINHDAHRDGKAEATARLNGCRHSPRQAAALTALAGDDALLVRGLRAHLASVVARVGILHAPRAGVVQVIAARAHRVPVPVDFPPAPA